MPHGSPTDQDWADDQAPGHARKGLMCATREVHGRWRSPGGAWKARIQYKFKRTSRGARKSAATYTPCVPPLASLTPAGPPRLVPTVQMVIETATSEIRSEGTMHIAVWCGLLLQHAYRDVLERGFVPPVTRVYISFYLFGSPAHKYKLVPKHWVVELNGQSVSSLTAFLELARTLPHGANVRLKTCDLNGKIGMYTVKTDHNYWRGYEVFADQHYEHKWVLRMLNEPREE